MHIRIIQEIQTDMTLVKKRALISAAAALAVLGSNLVAVPAALADEGGAPATPVTTESTTETSTEAPVQPTTVTSDSSGGMEAVTTPAPADGTPHASNEESTASNEVSPSALAAPTTATQPEVENTSANPPAESAAAASEPEKPTEVWIDKGFANWQFKQSFREYVGPENETLDRVKNELKSLIWNPRGIDQKFNTKNPTQVQFGGEVEWRKYNGILHIKLSNPTLDFTTKKLYVDAYTKGTLAGGDELTVKQEALLEMEDLSYEVKDGYIVIHSFRPRITELAHRIFGFYKGEQGAPFVATLEARQLGATPAPQPDLHDLFPDQFPRTGNGPIIDESEPVRDIVVPDEQLRQCILNEFDLEAGTPITNKVIQRLQSLNCLNPGDDTPKIKSLEGLQFAKNLTFIKFNFNNISDLSPLSHMTWLEGVELKNNAIRDLRPLSKLTKLNRLDVSNNKIASLAGLDKLMNLERLVANDNRIASLDGLPLGSEELRVLRLSNNRIESLEPLARLQWLRELFVDNNRITSVSGLDKIRAVGKLKINNNYITDPSHFAEWAERDHVESIYLAKNLFTEWVGIEAIKTKVRDWPQDPAAAVNPVSLEAAKAKDAEVDAADPAPQDEAPAPGGDNIGDQSSTPQDECVIDRTTFTVSGGNLTWGVRDSFTKYIREKAKGKWDLKDATWNGTAFVFPATGGTYSVTTHSGTFTYGGEVRFTGHKGVLDLTMRNPEIEINGRNGTLFLTVAGSNTDGEKFDLGRVPFATIALNAPQMQGAAVDFSSATVKLTTEGVKAFANFYDKGADLSAFTSSLTLAPKKVCPGDKDTTPADQPKTPDTTADTTPQDAPKAPQTGTKPSVNKTPSPAVKPVKECTVDPYKMRVTSGTLSWGVRSSFTSYIRGSIAKGGWDLNGVSWDGSDFNFPASGGIYDTNTRTGTIYYSGTVHFYGHKGILDVTMSNPAIEINGNSGALYLSVAGSDMQGNKFNLGRVYFANLSFNGVNAGNGSLSFEGAQVTLTAEGAKAFAGFYEAGVVLAPMSSSATLTPATACDPATGELIEYDAFGAAGGAGSLAKTGADTGVLVAMSLSILILGAAISRRRVTH